LDLGAAGIVVPRLDTAHQVREAVGFLRYPPDGVRGVALLTRGARLGSVAHADVSSINGDIVGIVQVESPGAVRDARAFAATDGVDVLFVGPADLSHSLGVPGQFRDEKYLSAPVAPVACPDPNFPLQANRWDDRRPLLHRPPATFARPPDVRARVALRAPSAGLAREARSRETAGRRRSRARAGAQARPRAPNQFTSSGHLREAPV